MNKKIIISNSIQIFIVADLKEIAKAVIVLTITLKVAITIIRRSSLEMSFTKKNGLLDKDILIQNFQKNSKKRKVIITDYKGRIEKIKKEKDEKIDILRDKIYQLKSQISDIEFTSSKQIRDMEQELHDKCLVLNRDIDLISEILYLLRIDKDQKLSWDESNYNKKYLEEIDTFFSSNTMILKSYVMENDSRNKVNRYSLCIAGKTIFNDKCGIDFPQESIPIWLTDTNIEKFVKKLPTPDNLKSYYVRDKSRILKDFLRQYRLLEQYYFHVIQNYTLSDFLPLAKAICKKCGYFIVELDSYNYFLDNHECPICFNHSYFKTNKEICK